MQSWKVAFIRTSHFSAHKVFYVTRAVTNLGEMKNFKNCRLGRSIDHNNIFSFPRLSYDCFQWRSLKELLTVLIAIEIHQMHGNKVQVDLHFFRHMNFFGYIFWAPIPRYRSPKRSGCNPGVRKRIEKTNTLPFFQSSKHLPVQSQQQKH